MSEFHHSPLFNFEGLEYGAGGITSDDYNTIPPLPHQPHQLRYDTGGPLFPPHQLPYSLFPPPPIEEFNPRIDWNDPAVMSTLASMMADLPENTPSLATKMSERTAALPSLPAVSTTDADASSLVREETSPAPRHSPPPLPAQVSLTDRIMEKGDSSSWAARNPVRPVIPARMRPTRRPLTIAEQESHAIKMAQKVEKRKKLQDAIATFIQDQSNRLHELAVTHDVSDKQVKDILGLKTHYHKECRTQLRNAIVHVKSKELNEGM
jgi:hypothetical protein